MKFEVNVEMSIFQFKLGHFKLGCNSSPCNTVNVEKVDSGILKGAIEDNPTHSHDNGRHYKGGNKNIPYQIKPLSRWQT